ncbi:PA14 domain-containing protein [Chryseobacterium limigenitum]|uniref:PA14 domain-containing protein n=1 Tax=Chryseobacterium limigenitum TaxID=1612149 RepID=A0A1K2IX83_9FLAO|nr:PA14 domain-containing protein [Chryseobacterium limigenitum]SFZ97036.1 PA14 domain-containing protein [Chryseobacterium limigenitum]
MRYKFKYMYLLLPLLLLLVTINVKAQYPGGVSTGTTRGYKVDYYNGTFSDQTGFGAGTSNAVPSLSEYSNKVTGTEFQPIDADYYGLEYSGTLEIPVSGNYTFSLSADDRAWLYIDGTLVVQAISGSGTATSGVSLTAGDHTIKVKYYELGGANSAVLQVANGPSGSNITTATDVDGRFVRYNNAKLTGWYKGSDLTVTANFGGAGIDKANSFINKAPDYAGNGNLNYSGAASGSSATTQSSANLVNFNQAVRFDGDDTFSSGSTIKGLSLRGATKTMFFVNNYVSNEGQSGNWMYFHGDATSNQRIGFYKNDGTGNQLAVVGAGVTNASAYIAGEPKLLGGFVDQVTGGTAPSGTNPLSLRSNGNAGTTASLLSYADHDAKGLVISNMNTAYIPEAIYYPFALNQTDERKVNTYLAVKYGITLAHDYINTSGATVFGLTTNTGYTNRIFGIGRELTVESLFQKQSQSQMTSTTGYDFLVVSKGAVAVSNAANTGTLADGDYLLLGDNAGSFTPQSTEVSSTLSTLCQFNRIGREWKAQITGAPGAVTVRAGSSTVGSFAFPGSASGIVMIVDTDNDGDFSNATTTYQPSSVVNGVATFDNVTLVTGNVITFGWTVTAPGGVSAGLKLWSKADDLSLATGNVAQWSDLSPNANHLIRTANANVTKIDNYFNYNPTISFGGAHAANLNSTAALGMNGDNTYSEFYILQGLGVGFLTFNEFITLGAGNTSGTSHRWENNTTTFATAKYGVYGNGTPANTGTGSLTVGQLGLYSSIANGTNAILSTNGASVWNNATTTGLSLSGTFRIGTDVNTVDGDTNWNSFVTPELIVYDVTISGTDLQKINSYLGIKYSIPLSDGSGTSASNYLASDGTVIWTGNATYKYGMFGIGRDDCSGLVQKQSKAYISGTDNVKFGLTKLATTNAENTGTFAANKQFIIVANDGGAFTGTTSNVASSYASTSCNPYRYVRSWKAQNTNTTTSPLQMTIGDATNPIVSNWSNVTLAINSAGDNTFATGTTTLVAATSVIGGVATFDNVTLPDGAVFTVYYTLGFPGGVSKSSSGISITTVSGTTTNNINGLEYKLYSTNGTAGTGISTGFSAYAPTLLSSGYYHNATDFHAFVNAKIGDNYGIELTGKLNVVTSTATYQFRGNANDDQFALIIDGNVLISTGGTFTTGNITLSAGYHDIIIRGRELAGAQNFDLQWNGGSGAVFVAIPDANFFTSPQGPSAWYDSADSSLLTLANGTTLSTWNDLGLYGNRLTNEGAGTGIYYSTNPTYIRNYNPSVFSNDNKWSSTSGYIKGFPFGLQSRSVFGVNSIYATGGNEVLTGYGIDNSAYHGFAVGKTGTEALAAWGSVNGLTGYTLGAAYYTGGTSASPITHILQYGLSGSALSGYGDGQLRGSAAQAGWTINMNDNKDLTIGNHPDGANGNGWNGNLNEIIYYPWDLSAVERQRVNSYLGIKWGVTLDQTTATSYLASDGSTVWNAATAAGIYNNDITGIGRDDCGALYQKQSTSTDGNDIVAVGLGSTGLAANNPQNTNTFSANKTFFMFAHNGAVITTKTNTNMPSSLSSCYNRLQREWQVQTLGTPGPVSFEFGKQGLLTINAATYKPVLLISNTPGNYTGATIVNYTKVKNGKTYFDNVSLASGQYFTLAYIEASPGGVNTSMTVWFNADYDSFTDISQTTYAENDGDKVASMNNIKFGATFTKVEQSNPAYQPVYYKAAFNYNSGLYFVGNGNSSLNSPSNVATTSYRSATQMTSIFAGYNLGTDSDPGPANVFWWTGTSNTDKTALERPQAFWLGSGGALLRTPALTSPEIYTFSNTTGSGYRLYSNLKMVGSGAANQTNTTTAPFYIGLNGAAGSGQTAGAKFYFGEFVIYSDDKGAANTYDMKRIHSYMAIKYGFTLDNTAIGGSYIASDGTVIYNDGSYWNRITGIGMDDCSGLDQRQSFSQQTTGALVKISNDPAGLAASNSENAAAFAADKSFLVYGDNNKSLTWNASENIKDASNTDLMRLNRVWRVKETGTVGTVYLEVPANTSTATTKLPAPLDSASDPIYMVVANTASGGVFNNPTIVAMIPKGTDWTVTYNFADGDYYTFATLESCLAPAGITDGLTTWYKTTNLTTGAIATGTANAMVDQYGTNSLNRNASGTATVTVGTPIFYNYNRYVTLAGTAAFTKSNVTETALTGVSNGALYVAAAGSGSLFGTSLSTTDKFFINNAGVYRNATGSALTGPASGNIYQMGVNNGVITSRSNGTTVTGAIGTTPLLAGTTYTIGLGTYPAGGSFNSTNLAEAFAFNRDLATYEKDKLDSYLAIKYGQTLSHNYYSPEYNGINTSTTTLYDVSTYGNRVFGVGNHKGGCFYQNQSSSSQQVALKYNSMLKISVDGILNTENSQNPLSWIEDQSYIMMGDDNGPIAWVTTNKPRIEASNTCLSRITRQWKVVSTKQNPDLLVTIADNSNTNHATGAKLDAIPANNDVYMVISDQEDFTSVTASQQIIKMTLNNISKEWEAMGSFDANTTRYITFVYKPVTCGLPCVPVNPATSRSRIN